MSSKKEIVRYRDTQFSITIPELDEIEKYGLGVLSEGLQRMRKVINEGDDMSAIKAVSVVTGTAKYISQRITESKIPMDDSMEIDDDYDIGDSNA